MKRFSDLTDNEKTVAISLHRTQLGLPPEIDEDPTFNDKLNKISKDKAKDAFYVEDGDVLVHIGMLNQPTE